MTCMPAHQPQESDTELQPEPAAAPSRQFSLLSANQAPPVSSTALFLDRLMKRRQESGYLIEEIGDVLLARVRVPLHGLRHCLLVSSPHPPAIRAPSLSHFNFHRYTRLF